MRTTARRVPRSPLCPGASGACSCDEAEQFQDTLPTAFARREVQRPQPLALRQEFASLKSEKKQTAQDNAHAVRESRNTIRTYADQIQVRTLCNAELQTAAW